ncbi:MAG: ribosome-associated translation inhibitor RaiA [Candidatus Sericytochromatia bacterium]
MAKLVIKGKNIDVTPALRDFISRKLSKLDRYAKHIIEISVEMHVEKNPRIAASNIVDVNIYANGAVLRAEEASHDMYAAIDVVLDKLERQMKKYEDKKVRSKTDKLKLSQYMAGNDDNYNYNDYDEREDNSYITY